MSAVRPSFRADAHSYTRSHTPWIIGEYHSTYGKLIHYLSGGGMRTFGRTIGQEEARRKHRAFLTVASALGALWLLFYFL